MSELRVNRRESPANPFADRKQRGTRVVISIEARGRIWSNTFIGSAFRAMSVCVVGLI